MSLVDYASSDEEEQDENRHPQPSTAISSAASALHPPALPPHLFKPSSVQPKEVSPSPIEKLPDASLLLSSPFSSQQIGSDHSSRVAAAMAENASRKREANGSSSSNIRSKIARGNSPHSKNITDTSSVVLMPPQLRGRSNVVTEDINKLFVRRKSQGKS